MCTNACLFFLFFFQSSESGGEVRDDTNLTVLYRREKAAFKLWLWWV